MSETPEDIASLNTWLAMPMDTSVKAAIERVRRADDVVQVAVLPDVHLAGEVCVGMAMATRRLIYPSAVGGDIGCGMLAIAFDASAELLTDAVRAGMILRHLGKTIPAQRHTRTRTLPLPASLNAGDLSHPLLQALADDEGRLQFGTLGGGNHFVELQADEDDRLWLMIHSGSRAVGQAVKGYHLSRATIRSGGMVALDSTTADGQAYLRDQEWARCFAHANRHAMALQVVELLRTLLNIKPIDLTIISCDHNHVCREEQSGRSLLIHREGAMPAHVGSSGVVPGSMGTVSFHVEGRASGDSLWSSAHGAGRLLSRHAAREQFSRTELRGQMRGVWFDPRMAETPSRGITQSLQGRADGDACPA